MKPLPEALSIARSMDLDLVEVAAEANPPVCRIMDFNRFKYEAAQRAKESRRKATTTGIKEMKYRPKIGVGDFDTKTRQVARFLGEGHKVKITIMFRGREMSHPELGKKILDQVAETVAGVAKVEAAPKLDGRNMIMVLAPDRRGQGTTRKGAPTATPEGAGTSPTPTGPPRGPAPEAPEATEAAEAAEASGAAEPAAVPPDEAATEAPTDDGEAGTETADAAVGSPQAT